MGSYRVLVIGGYGFFGSRLVERLSHNSQLHLLVAGRSATMAQSLVGRLQPTAQATMQAVALDAMSPNLGPALAAFSPDAVVHTSGASSVQAILSYCGQPLPGGTGVHGWSSAWRHRYSRPVGRRLLSPCDVPDLSLLPARYEGMPRVRFGAGLELVWLHHTMNLMAALTRLGLVKDWSAHARALKRLSDLFKHWGSDAGAMHVSVSGKAADGTACTRQWELVATHGDGPFVPTLAAAALVRKLAAGQALPAGAQPCIGLLGLDDFTAEAEDLSISTKTGP
jgi:hypothetical protein